MGRSPSIPVEEKTRIVLSVIAGELRVGEQLVGRWKAGFLEAGKEGCVGCGSVGSLLACGAARGRGRGPDPGVG